MTELLEDPSASFARHLRAEGKAKRTIALYCTSVRLFGEWCTANGRGPVLDELTRAAIRDWLADLADRHAPSTARTHFNGMRRFTNWLVSEGDLPRSPMAGMSAPAAPPKPVPLLDDAQLGALVKACTGRTFNDRRDEAMIRLFIDCGVRVAELCGLGVDDLDLNNEMAIVLGKGGKRRPIYYGARTARALDRYLRERKRHPHAHLSALFLAQRGAISPDGVRERIKIRCASAGLPADTHPHSFRHTFAHDFLVSGGQERDLKRLAGWSSDAMLERYGSSAADMRAQAAARRLRRGDRI